MKNLALIWREEDGVLSFEWALLITLVVIGVVSGLAGARDAVIDELGDSAQAMQALDHSYTIDFPLAFEIDGNVIGGASDSGFNDAINFVDCDRTGGPAGQIPELDNDS